MRLLLLGLGLQIIVLRFAGCGQDEPVIARVGDAVITAAEFQRFVDRLSPGLQSGKEGREADLDHLQSMVDQKLLLQEAHVRGVDTSAVVSRKLPQLVRARLVELYRARVIAPRVEVALEDVERAFTEMGFNRERLFSRILVRTPEELEEVMQQLREGRAFEALAQRFAANDLFAVKDGTVGWIGHAQAQRQFAIAERIFSSLPMGEVAEPMPLAGGWQIYRFLEEREAELANYGREISKMLEREQLRAKGREEFEVLSRRYGLRLHPEGIRLLLQRTAPQPIRSLELSPDEAAQPLYSFEGGEIACGDFLAALKPMGFQDLLQDSLQVVELAERFVLPSYIAEQAARRQGWDREPEFVEWRQRKEEELILTNLIREEVSEPAEPTEEEIRAFYEADRERFRTSDQVIIGQVWAATEAEAQKLRREIERGVGISELLDRPGVETHGNPHKGGELRLWQIFRGRFPELLDAAYAAQEGDLVGPIEVKTLDGYVVFRVLKQEGGDIQPFDQVRRRAGVLLRKGREEERIKAFIQHLQEKYRDQVAVFPERLG